MSILSSSSPGRAHGVSSGGEMPDSWRGQGLCIAIDPEFFFPVESETAAAKAQARQAKAVCRGCPVLAQCREFELTPTSSGRLRSEYGVFAGMTAEERRVELYRRARRSGGVGVAA